MPPLVPSGYSAQPPLLALFRPVWANDTDACSPFRSSFCLLFAYLSKTHAHNAALVSDSGGEQAGADPRVHQ